MSWWFGLSQRALFALDPEGAHGLSLRSLRRLQSLGLLKLGCQRVAPAPVTVAGIALPNPVGLAAGSRPAVTRMARPSTPGTSWASVSSKSAR